MPRNISATSLAILQNNIGNEPVNIVEIRWTDNGESSFYSDRYIDNIVKGQILELGDFESIVNLDKSGNSSSINIKLDDTDGVLKETLNNNDIHGRPATVYQWFSSIPLSEKFPIFEGIIASPIEWNEGDRTLSFEILTKLEDREVGFSVEEGDFDNVPPEIIGRPWPLVFGTVLNVPTLQLDQIPSGTTRIPIGIPDHHLQQQIDYIEQKTGEETIKAICLSRTGAELETKGQFEGAGKDVFEQGQNLQRQARDIYKKIGNEHQKDKQRLQNIKNDQDLYDVSSIPIINGHKFHQGVTIELEINKAHYVGSFSGDTFNVQFRRGPDEPAHKAPKDTKTNVTKYDYVVENLQEVDDQRYADFIFGITPPDPSKENKAKSGDPCGANNIYIFHNKPPVAPEPPTQGKFFFANAGTSVKPGNNYSLRYILSIVPGTRIIALSAKHSSGGLKVLSPIPPERYSISTETFGSITAVIATLSGPLSSIEEEDWENDIYATLQSPIGPNIVDILTYLIQTYTPFSIDNTSFLHVREREENYPANFAILDRKNIVALLKDIAWQSRCSLWISNNTFFIRYLPEELDYIETLVEDDIQKASMIITTTPTEDLTTKFIAKWKDDLSVQKENLIILRYNINKYGVHEKSFDFYIYNDVDLVYKSAVFWLIRYANIWKILKCKSFISKLRLETLDPVLLNFNRNWIANVPVTGTLDKCTFNSSDLSISMEIWTPVRLGEMYPYQFAYPADIDASIIFPTINDVAGRFSGGDGPGSDATGDFGTNTITNTIQFMKGTGKSGPISDKADGPKAPIVTTTGPWNNVGTGAATGQLPRANTATGVPQGAVQPPGYDYRYRNYNRPAGSNEDPQPASFPGRIVSGSGRLYNVDVFQLGLSDIRPQRLRCTQLQIDSNETIPPGTWVIVHRLVWYTPNGAVNIQHVMQVPIWIEQLP